MLWNLSFQTKEYGVFVELVLFWFKEGYWKTSSKGTNTLSQSWPVSLWRFDKKCYIRGSIWRFDTKYGILGESYGDLIQNKLHLETFMEIRCEICFIRRCAWRFETKYVYIRRYTGIWRFNQKIDTFEGGHGYLTQNMLH